MSNNKKPSAFCEEIVDNPNSKSRQRHIASLSAIQGLSGYDFDSGDLYFEAISDLAVSLPKEPFLKGELEYLLSSSKSSYETLKFFIIFAKSNHTEIAPYVLNFFEKSDSVKDKLSAAAALAQLGEESGYQYIESVFQRFMKQDEDMKNFDFEEFVFIFDEILTNERGQEMIARFRKEANYDVVWETLEVPEVD